MKKLFQMKKLKLLNKKFLSVILFYLFFGALAQSQEPVDIWNIEEKKTDENFDPAENNIDNSIPQNSIYESQSQKYNELKIEEDKALIANTIKIESSQFSQNEK